MACNDVQSAESPAEAARESMSEAAQAAREAAELIRGANPDAVPVPDVEPEPPEAVAAPEPPEAAEELSEGLPADATLDDVPALEEISELNNEGVDLERERAPEL